MRADKYFAGRFGSRTKAAQALKAGLVLRGGKPLSPDDRVEGDEGLEFLSRKEQFVSEGGYKLARGLDAFGESVEGMVFADLGAGSGGFTDCLLQRGAKKVFCVDVGESGLSGVLLQDGRVCLMPKRNARYLTPADFPCPLDGVVSDLSFISLRLVLPAVRELLPPLGKAFVLFKPQFECGKRAIPKSGICPPALHGELLGSFYDFCLTLSLAPRGLVNAPIREKKNIEYVFLLQKDGEPIAKRLLLGALKTEK